MRKPEFFRRLLAIDERARAHPYYLAELAMAAGDSERALPARNFFLPFSKRDPLFAPLHGNRYESAMQRLGL